MAAHSDVFERAKRYQDIKHRLVDSLVQSPPANDRLPPLKDLARRLGAGQFSTHRAVKELVKEGLLVSRPRLGTFLSESFGQLRPEMPGSDSSASEQSARRTTVKKWVQLLAYGNPESEAGHQFHGKAVNSFISTLSELGVRVTIRSLPTAARDTMGFIDKDPDAVAVVNPSSCLRLECLASQALTIISTTSECRMGMAERYDLVSVDDRQGGFLAGQRFRQLGWDEVCFVGVGQRDSSGQVLYDATSIKRLVGLEQGLGHEVRPEHRLLCESYSTIHGAQALPDWRRLDPCPRAIFAASDDIAFGFIHGAWALGLLAGREYQIVGFDGQQDGPLPAVGRVATIAVPFREMGSLGARLLMERLGDPGLTPRRVQLGCSLVEGDTLRSFGRAAAKAGG